MGLFLDKNGLAYFYQKIKVKIDSVLSTVNNHIGNKSNPHGVTASQIGAAASSHTHSYLPLAGGSMNSGAVIRRLGKGSAWFEGRNNALICVNSSGASIYVPIISNKTQNGSWDVGTYTSNRLHFSYISDSDYNAGTNKQTANIYFGTDGSVTANKFIGTLSGNSSSATKLATKRTIAISGGAIGTATGFDGSANISIPVTKLNMSKASGTFPTAVRATNSTDYTTSRPRNIRASTTDLTPKSSSLSNGEIYLVYE